MRLENTLNLSGNSPSPKGRVAVAMSGGVDSSVAAALLLEQGWDVVGIHLKLHDIPDSQRRDKSCCSIDDALDARQVCARLGIPFYVLDFVKEFRARVIDYFAASYRRGLTPNPCVMCNRAVKHALLMDKAREFGCDYLATGHYARVERAGESGNWRMLRPRDRHKDQTYFLFGTPREELPYQLYPLADLEKEQARALAGRYGFITWNKPDSQEVCFVPKDYRTFLEEHFAGDLPLPGEFVDSEGRVLGQHRGLAFYTVGQRRGLGLSAENPLYVVSLHPGENRILLGSEAELLASHMTVADVNWVSLDSSSVDAFREGRPLEALVKVRYSHAGTTARITPLEEGGSGGGNGGGACGGENPGVRVEFAEPVRAIAPGQAAAFYDGDVLLGGGWIQPARES